MGSSIIVSGSTPYGRIVDNSYWDRCKKSLEKLPKNIKASFLGELKKDEVTVTFSKYDLFFFPTGGENYGHVIAESLSVGTPVLISKNTPWFNLESQHLGWDIDLEKKREVYWNYRLFMSTGYVWTSNETKKYYEKY